MPTTTLSRRETSQFQVFLGGSDEAKSIDMPLAAGVFNYFPLTFFFSLSFQKPKKKTKQNSPPPRRPRRPAGPSRSSSRRPGPAGSSSKKKKKNRKRKEEKTTTERESKNEKTTPLPSRRPRGATAAGSARASPTTPEGCGSSSRRLRLTRGRRPRRRGPRSRPPAPPRRGRSTRGCWGLASTLCCSPTPLPLPLPILLFLLLLLLPRAAAEEPPPRPSPSCSRGPASPTSGTAS